LVTAWCILLRSANRPDALLITCLALEQSHNSLLREEILNSAGVLYKDISEAG